GRDRKYCSLFRQLIEAGSVKTLALPPRSPNLNAYAERWVRSVKEECLAKLILLGEGSLRRALRHYEAHYHEERNHQGKGNVLLSPLPTQTVRGEQEKLRCRERLGGLLKYYEREAACAFGGVNFPSSEAKMRFLTIRDEARQLSSESNDRLCNGLITPVIVASVKQLGRDLPYDAEISRAPIFRTAVEISL